VPIHSIFMHLPLILARIVLLPFLLPALILLLMLIALSSSPFAALSRA
jgi:hypothetical protein